MTARHWDYARARKRDRPDAREILVVVCHERVAKCEQHDEPEHRAECGDEKRGRDFDTAPEVSPKEVDGRARRDACEQPDVVE